MKTRVISAAVLLPILLLVLLALPELVTALLISVMSALAAYELLFATGLVRHTRLVCYSAAIAFAVPLWSHLGGSSAWGMLGLLIFLCALFAEMMYDHVKVRFDKVCYCLIAGILIPFLFSSIVRILNGENGRMTVLIPLILAFIPDSGAYFAGRYFGRHKLSPVISPNKTVEGAIGGAAVCILGMLLFALVLDLFFPVKINYVFALIYGLLGAGGDVFGDLMFSAVKRQTGIKDYGNLIPGHGGVLDRFDSMLIVAPLVEVLQQLIPVVA